MKKRGAATVRSGTRNDRQARGSRREIDYLWALLSDPQGTGADRQIAAYQQTHSIDAVLQLLMRQTMLGIPLQEAVLTAT